MTLGFWHCLTYARMLIRSVGNIDMQELGLESNYIR